MNVIKFFSQWTNTDRENLSKMVSDIESFINRLIDSLEELRQHSFIAKGKSRYLRQLKEDLDSSSVLFFGDLAEFFICSSRRPELSLEQPNVHPPSNCYLLS